MRFASLGSGSAGNGLVVEAQTTRLLLDCGFGLRDVLMRLARLDLAPEQLSGILVTHEHDDHAGGAFRLANKYQIPVWLTHGTLTMIERFAGGKIPASGAPALPELEDKIARAAKQLPATLEHGFGALTFRENLQAIWELIGLCDEYIDKAAPWKLAKNPDDGPQLKTVLNTAARALRLDAAVDALDLQRLAARDPAAPGEVFRTGVGRSRR